MTDQEAQNILDTIIAQVFGYKNPYTLEQFRQKFCFDINLPQPVYDSMDGSIGWAQSTNPTKYISMENARNLEIGGMSAATDFLRTPRPLESIEDILAAWGEINYTTTSRVSDSINVARSDNVGHSENVYHSTDVRHSKNILFTDGIGSSEFTAACQRSGDLSFCIRVDDSGDCTNCFSVAWCGNLTNCMFMHDASDMQDSLFCTNIKGKRFCVANMQYTEEEYRKIRDIVARWVLTS